MTIDKPKRIDFFINSIPAKPLAQAKLKCGGFFISIEQAGFPRNDKGNLSVRKEFSPRTDPLTALFGETIALPPALRFRWIRLLDNPVGQQLANHLVQLPGYYSLPQPFSESSFAKTSVPENLHKSVG